MKYNIALQTNSRFQLLLLYDKSPLVALPFTLIPGRSVKTESRQLPLSNLV